MFSVWKISLLFMASLALTAATIPGKKDRRPLGGWTDVNVTENDSGLQKALEVAIREHNKASNDQFINVVTNVIRARRQIVAGMKYSLNVQIAKTDCRKSDSTPENCTESELSRLSQHKRCRFVVYLVPWLKKEELKQNNCD
ncbi:cystatin [Microcaecilia unicolor]|uniref:Cystatin-like n=1 Tax=Microcaecilia unicolor TaxID=1415580 RepID=A0A6P7X953_9AMPH|nr:cystatin-like [Microcaecilia unicolor]